MDLKSSSEQAEQKAAPFTKPKALGAVCCLKTAANGSRIVCRVGVKPSGI